MPKRATDGYCVSAPNWLGYCDGYGTITVAPRLADNFNVLDFGAKGDGVTDDTTAIMAAINSLTSTDTSLVGWVGGGTVLFPAGIYICSSAITLPLNVPMIIAGEGAYCTQLQFTTASNGIQQLYPSGTLAATHISIRDLQLVNKKTNYIEIQVYGNYWQAGKSTAAQWGPVGTLVALPGCATGYYNLQQQALQVHFYHFQGLGFGVNLKGPPPLLQ